VRPPKPRPSLRATSRYAGWTTAPPAQAPPVLDRPAKTKHRQPDGGTGSSGRRDERRTGYRDEQRARVRNDELGKLISEHTTKFLNASWEKYVSGLRGRGDIEIGELAMSHAASEWLRTVSRNGVPAVMATAPWTEDLIDERVKRGAHQSCDEHLEFLREEILDFVRKGFWTLLPYRLVKQRLRAKIDGLKRLRVSPIGIVPQRERRPRLIVDYTYYGVNQETQQLSPSEAMQFGRALERILYNVRHANPAYGPVFLGKIDLADGFYRVWLTTSAIPELAVAFPKYEGEEQMVAMPLVLPMGWVDSPPAFCAVTETVADIANNIPYQAAMPPHPMEGLVDTPPEPLDDGGPRENEAHQGPPVLRPFRHPVRHIEIYVDDYVQQVQGVQHQRTQNTRRLLYSIDSVFRPVDDQDPPTRADVPSRKKMKKGDAYLATRKAVLGWIIDTLRGTLELPPHRQERLHEIFEYLRGRTRVGVSKWRKILGELRSMSIGIPGSRGLFSLLQEGLRHTDKHRIRLTRDMVDQLLDFEYLANELCTRPTSLSEIVPDHPVAVGPHDAAGPGMGGAWIPATSNSNLDPIAWRAPFPEDIQADLVSWENPSGTITNSDLELAGGVAHQDVLLQDVDCTGRTVTPLSDNTPSVAWTHKGSTTTTGPAAYILRLSSLHQRHFRYLVKSDYISGPANQLADDCSRLWHLSDAEFLTHLNSTYPQSKPWRLVQLRPEMHSSLISALLRQRVDPQSYLNEPNRKTVTGKSGKSSLPLTVGTPTSADSVSKRGFLFSRFSPPGSEAATLPPATNLSELNRWRTTYAPLPRRSPGWGPRTHA